MFEISLPAALAIIVSVATICLTILRIVNSKRNNGNTNLEKKVVHLCSKTAVQDSQIKDIKEEQNRLHDNFDKLNDLLLRILSEK